MRNRHYTVGKNKAPVKVKTLTGEIFTVSKMDHESISRYRWSIDKRGNYIHAQPTNNNQGMRVRIHRFILEPPESLDVDHKDNNPLNNTRDNIRICNRSQNNINKPSKNKYGVSGIEVRDGLNIAAIYIKNKKRHIGCFNMVKDAVHCRKYIEYVLYEDFSKHFDEVRKLLSNGKIKSSVLKTGDVFVEKIKEEKKFENSKS